MGLKRSEVWVRGDGGVVGCQLNETVVVVAHEPLIDDTAGENAGHVAEEDFHLCEGAVGGAAIDALDATVFGEEDGDGVVREEVHALAVR